jgi:vanillate O-demethylase ferredoxin subunit
MELVVTDARIVAEGIRCYALADAGGAALPPFEAGAHIDVHLPNGIVRQYSLCNRPGERDRYVIAVLREPDGRGGSAAMHDGLAVGGRIAIGRPRNFFPVVREARHHLLLAGGIGITPLLAMTRAFAAEGTPFTLHYCARSAARMAFREELTAPPFAPHVVLHLDDGPAEQRLDLAALLRGQAPGTHLYYCGPAGFMAAVRAAAEAAGWPADALHCEYFAAPAPIQAGGAGFELRLARRGLSLWVPPERSAVEVLAAHGIEVPTSCEQGICGTCLTPVLEGIPDHRDAVLSDAEKAANKEMTLCCSRARTPYLVVDL